MRQRLISWAELILAYLRGPQLAYPAEWLEDLFRHKPMCSQEEHDACGCMRADSEIK